MPGHRSHHTHNPHYSSELTHRLPPRFNPPPPPPPPPPPSAEVRCLIIRYASLIHTSDHARYGLPYVRHFRNSNRRGLVTDVPTSGVVSKNNLKSIVTDKLTEMMNREFANWKFIGAERSMPGPQSNNTPHGYRERRANVYIERRQ